MSIDTQFSLVSGTYTAEQDILFELDFFLTNTIGGWVQHKVVTDTPTDKNIVYYTDGSSQGQYDRLWVRIQATSDSLQFNALSNFDGLTNTDFDLLGGTADNFEINVTSASGGYWFLANRDCVHIVIERSSDNLTLHGGFGHFNTYYTAVEDPKPFYVFGQTTTQSFSSFRLSSYTPHSWGSGYSTVFSGIAQRYVANHPPEIKYGTPNPRSGQPKLVEPVFYSSGSFGAYESRGEVPGLYMCGGTGLTTGSVITITNMLPTVTGRYLIHKQTDEMSWAIGPTTVSGEV